MGAIYYKGEKYGAMPASAANLPYDAGSQDSTKDKIDSKADSSSVYTKTESDNLLAGKASASLINSYQSKSGSPAVVAGVGGYAVVMVVGFAQGVGAIAVLIQINNAALASQIDMFTGAAFSKPQVTFTYNASTQQLSINTTNANNSTFTVIKGGI